MPEAPLHAHLRRGAALLGGGDGAGAAAAFAAALAIAPDDVAAHRGMALALMRQGDAAGAVRHYRLAVAAMPDDAGLRNGLGIALSSQGNHAQAAAQFARAAELAPDLAAAHANLGKARLARGQAAAAVESLERAAAIEPGAAAIWNDLGSALRALGRFDAAVASYRRAIELAPDDLRARNNLAVALQETGAVEAAIQEFRRIAAAAPDQAASRKSLGIALLLTGRYGEGFDEYEWRWREATAQARPRPFSQPRWDGTTLAGRSLLVWGEQGVGDELLFASMVPDLLEADCRCVIECDARLVPLFARSFPGVLAVARSDPPDPRTQTDWQIPAGSLARLLRRAENEFPHRNGYLVADAARVAQLRTRYRSSDNRRLVGIAWRSGNPTHGARRSVTLEAWAPILSRSGVTFINLQYGDCGEALGACRAALAVEIRNDPEIDPLADLDGFAAQVAAMDLVISIDNATVHMAGALGRPVWTLLPDAPDWRWRLERCDTPWYPSMRLFRQHRPGDWSGVVAEVAASLEGWTRL